MLPYMSDKSMMRPTVRTQFRGLNHNKSAGDGEIFWMENISSREYPLLTPRKPRGLVETLTAPNGIGAGDALWWVDGTDFYYNGEQKGSLWTEAAVPYDPETAVRQFVLMGSLLLIFPDKAYYDILADSFGWIEKRIDSSSMMKFGGSTYAGAPASANTIFYSGQHSFAVGDAVTISGCRICPENNKTAIIREIADGEIRFYEGTFRVYPKCSYKVTEELPAGDYWFQYDWEGETGPVGFTLTSPAVEGDEFVFSPEGSTAVHRLHDGQDYLHFITVIEGQDSFLKGMEGAAVNPPPVIHGGVTGTELQFGFEPDSVYEPGGDSYHKAIVRKAPDLDYVCVHENRLWGCKGDTIYASALGDPFNFNVFDGLSTDSWASDTTDAGDFTGCISYQGYPLFFKEDAIFKVQGDGAANFSWTRTSRFGVKPGCDRSLAVAGETLFYLSRVGICAYQGGMPSVVSGPLGANMKWYDAVGGSDGLRYYVSMRDENGDCHLFCFDTRCGEWFREDDSEAKGFAFWDDGLYMLLNSGGLYRMDGADGEQEDTIAWEVTFADSTRLYETSDTASQNKKGLSRLMLRCELEADAMITVSVSYDKGSWKEIGKIKGDSATDWSSGGAKMKSYNLPLILRRCDSFRLKLSGIGDAVIYSLTEVKYGGSHLQGGKLYTENSEGGGDR